MTHLLDVTEDPGIHDIPFVPDTNYCNKCDSIIEDDNNYCYECLEEIITKDIALKFVDEADSIIELEFFLNINLWRFSTPDDFMVYLKNTPEQREKDLIENTFKFCLQHEDFDGEIDGIMEELK